MFDYIVVGAGSAGAVVASRLSEDPDISVALVEAGTSRRHWSTRMPLGFVQSWGVSRLNWGWTSEPEAGLCDRRIPVRGGQGLGGSSSINGMIYTRGNPLDYDLWRQEGLEGWGYADVLPYFKKLERSWRGETAYHGASGPIGVTQVTDPSFPYEALEDAATSLGYPKSPDLYGEDVEGISRMELTIDRGERSSVERGYLRPAYRRRNLTILRGANVRRILFDGRRACGVEFKRNGKLDNLKCREEIVLSAGALHSPRLLLLSGIGAASDLRDVGIETLVDLPFVGRNLNDHTQFVMSWRAASNSSYLDNFRWDRAGLHALRWAFTRTGPLCQNGSYSNQFVRSRPDLARPDIQLIGTSMGLDASAWFPLITKKPVHSFSQLIYGLHPLSRGDIRLASSNPDDQPRVRYNLLSNPADLETLVSACRVAREIYQAPPQAALIDEELVPGKFTSTDRDIEAFLRRTVQAGQHAVGTCRMGAHDHSVVDGDLRVRGVTGLRVIDASVMPETPGGNTNVPAIMVGEKGADLIRGHRTEASAVRRSSAHRR